MSELICPVRSWLVPSFFLAAVGSGVPAAPAPSGGDAGTGASGEYRFAHDGAQAFSADNRAQRLACEVSPAGVEIRPLVSPATWSLVLRTRSFGRDSELPLDEPRVSAQDERVTLDHGALVEWLENRPSGIEQGWTIEERPGGDGPLRIELEIDGGFELRVDAGGRAGLLVARDAVLGYGGLRAWDARGTELPARLIGGKDAPRIEVRDAGALYPLTVDPTLSWMVEGDQAGANLGNSVASAGDVNGDGYDDVIVGAPYYTNGEEQEGRAYLYLGSASGPSTTPAWTAEGNLAFASFGIDVASAGDVNGDTFADVIVGANFYANVEVDEGAVFVYHGSPSGLATTPASVFEGNQEFANFGTAVEGVGDVNGDGFDDVFVGAPFYTNVELYEGRAFVYMGSSNGLGSTPWTAECDQADAFLGITGGAAGDVDGDTFDDVLVGASWFDDDQVDEGRVFLYMGSASGLETTPDWMEDGDQTTALFGVSVARAGDVDGDGFGDVLVGSLFDNGELDEGRAYLYMGSASGLETTPAWTAETDQINAQLGVALSGGGDVDGDGFDDALVGALRYDHGESDEGRVFLYRGSASGLATTPVWTAESDQGGAFFGASTASGDMNGDGYGDVLIGASHYDNGVSDEGAAFLYLGVPHLVLGQQKISQTAGGFGGNLTGLSFFGRAVRSIGDLDADGIPELAVGEPGRVGNTTPGEGGVWILFLNADGTVASEQEIDADTGGFTGTLDSGDFFGGALEAPGDLDGDDVPDLLVGAEHDDDGGNNRGAVWILYLNANGTVKAHAKFSSSAGVSGLDDLDEFGSAIAALGDLDGAGASPLALAIGAGGDDDGGTDRGSVHVLFLDSGEAVTAQAKISSTSGGFAGPVTDGDVFGFGLATLGDLDGTGSSVLALAVGAGQDDTAGTQAGALWILFLNSSGSVLSARKITEGTGGFGGELADDAHFGVSCANLGELDGVGAVNLAIGADEEGGAGDLGAVWILSLDSSGHCLGAEEIREGQHNFSGDLDVGDGFGHSVASLGDIDGDGRPELTIGARGDDDGSTDKGAVWVLGLNDGSVNLAASTTWTGATDREWSDDTNWSAGEPDADTTAIIPDAATTPNDPLATNANESCDHLFIQAGGTVELAGGADNLQIFGGATVLGPITGTGEVVFERAGTLAGDSTISATGGVRADADLALQGGSPANPLTITTNLSGNADLEVRSGADVDVGVDLFALGDLVLDGALSVGGSLDVDGGLIESVAEGGGGSGSLYVGGAGGDCVSLGQVVFSGIVATASSTCTLNVENSSNSDALVFDLANGWPNSVVFDVAGTITILTQDLSIGGDLTLVQGNLSIGSGVQTLTIAGDVTVNQGTLSVGSDVEIDANAVVVEAGAVLDVTGRQLFIPAPIPMIVRGTLAVGPGGELLLESNTVTVESGGTLRLAGGPGLARMSGFGTERYTLDLQSGSTLAADNFAFTQMSAAGIVIGNAVTIAPSPLNLRNGLFDRPANGGVLLDVSRTLPTEFRYLRFENSGGATGANNVHVPASSATITMVLWSGAFGGPTFEDDPGGKLDWGMELADGVVASPKLGANAPDLPTFPLVVGSGGGFTDVGSALASLTNMQAGECVTLELAAGAHAPFTLGPALGVDLVLTSAPGAWIDATGAPVLISGLPAERSVEMRGLVLDATSAAGPALLIEDANGVVLLDGVTVRGGAQAPAVLLAGASAVALQGGMITGTSAVNLALERGSRASTSGVEIGSIALAGRSQLETRGMDVEPSLEPGSHWRRSAPAPLLRVSAAGVVTLDAGGGTLAWLLAGPHLGFAPAASERIAGTLLLDPRALFVLGVQRVPAGGRAAWKLGVLHGDGDAPLQLQALIAGLGEGACAWSEVLPWGR